MNFLMFTRDINQDELGFAGYYASVDEAKIAKTQFDCFVWVIIEATTRKVVAVSENKQIKIGDIF